ncbi:MAG: SBBP repeat-containing protein [Chitinophagaceae bacterium]|nr:SBBP repeat-containing protein [Chitinophagaceae bacterium]
MGSFNEKGFLENKGQVKNTSGKINDKVKFIYSRDLFNLELKQGGFSYELFQAVPAGDNMDEAGFATEDKDNSGSALRIASSVRIDVSLEGADKNATIEASDATGAYFNYYYAPVKTNRIERVKAFNTITYHNIYPGIDLIFTAPNDEKDTPLHYDFVLQPGADPNMIDLKYSGNHALTINDKGAVQLNTAIGYVEEGKPVSFLKTGGKEVYSAYAIEKNHVKYTIGEYDKTQTLIIDPTLMWGTYYGGEKIEDAAKVVLDKKKSPIISGNTTSISNIASAGAFQTVYGGDPSDLFVAKFKTNGKLEWASYFGGNSKDLGYGACTDKSNNVILYGKAVSDGLATIGQMDSKGSGDGIIAKFTSAGIFLWSTYKGSANDDHYRNVITDNKGNLYCAGYTESKVGIATPGAYQEVFGGSGDCLFSKFTPDGVELWTTYFGALGSDRFHAINFDIYNRVLLEGTTGSTTDMTTTGVHQTTFGGGDEDVLLAVFDTSGQRIWSTYFGGEYSDRGRGVESDIEGNIYITGLTESTMGIATPGAHQETWTPAYDGTTRLEDGYLAKFTTTGQRVWGTYYGGSDYDRIWGMTLDRNAHAIYVAGGTKSLDSIASPNAWQQNKVSGADGFFARWDYNGKLIWGSYIGSNSEEHIQDIEQDADGFIYLLGVTSNNRMPVTTGVYQTESNGNDEVILYRFYAGLDCYDYNEPNNTFSTAKQVQGWLPADTIFYGFTGGIVNGVDQDFFKTKPKDLGSNFMFILSDKPASYNLKLYNSQQVLLQSSNNPVGVNDTIVYNNAPGSFCYIKIGHNNSTFDSLNCYRLKIYQSTNMFPKLSGNYFETDKPELLTLTVFPNPADAQLSFSLTSPSSGNSTLIIYDLLGRIMSTKEIALTEGYQSLQIPLAGLPKGSYKLLLKSNEKNWVAGFIKQ